MKSDSAEVTDSHHFLEVLCTLVGCLRAIVPEEEVEEGKNQGNDNGLRHTTVFWGEISFSKGDWS